MARPPKAGLDYFPKDTDTYSDRKIRRLLKEVNTQGSVIYDYLLCLIYRDNGYYIEYNDELCFDIADFLECGITEDLVKQVILTCVKLDLFDAKIFNSSDTLTSAGIQKRYIKIKRTGVIDEEMRVSSVKNRVIAAETPIKAEESTERKVKERKEKESTVKETQQQQPISSELTSEEIKQFSECAVKDKIWLEQLCIGAHIEPKNIGMWIAQFNASLSGFRSPDFSVNSYKRIFRGWLNKQPTNHQSIAELKDSPSNWI